MQIRCRKVPRYLDNEWDGTCSTHDELYIAIHISQNSQGILEVLTERTFTEAPWHGKKNIVTISSHKIIKFKDFENIQISSKQKKTLFIRTDISVVKSLSKFSCRLQETSKKI